MLPPSPTPIRGRRTLHQRTRGRRYYLLLTHNYTDGSQYDKNLYRLLHTITMTAPQKRGFYDGTVGVGADKILALFICYAEVNDSVKVCQNCLIPPGDIMKTCP